MPPIMNPGLRRASQLLTIDQAAQVLDLRPATIRRWCKDGRLQPVYRLPGARAGWRIPASTIDALLSDGLHGGAAGGIVADTALELLAQANARAANPAPVVSSRGARR